MSSLARLRRSALLLRMRSARGVAVAVMATDYLTLLILSSRFQYCYDPTQVQQLERERIDGSDMDSSSAKKEAKNQKTTPTRLLELSQHPDLSVQLAVAKHPSTPSAALEFLSIHGKPTVFKAVAAHPNTPSATLERLAAHPHHAVR